MITHPKNLGIPQPIHQINQGVNGHTRAPPRVPHTRASLEPRTSGFLTLHYINGYATWQGTQVTKLCLPLALPDLDTAPDKL